MTIRTFTTIILSTLCAAAPLCEAGERPMPQRVFVQDPLGDVDDTRNITRSPAPKPEPEIRMVPSEKFVGTDVTEQPWGGYNVTPQIKTVLTSETFYPEPQEQPAKQPGRFQKWREKRKQKRQATQSDGGIDVLHACDEQVHNRLYREKPSTFVERRAGVPDAKIEIQKQVRLITGKERADVQDIGRISQIFGQELPETTADALTRLQKIDGLYERSVACARGNTQACQNVEKQLEDVGSEMYRYGFGHPMINIMQAIIPALRTYIIENMNVQKEQQV